MKVSGQIMVRDVFKSDSGVSYISGVDMETGGDIKLYFEGTIDEPKVILTPVNFSATVKGRLFDRSVSYSVINGDLKFTPIKS